MSRNSPRREPTRGQLAGRGLVVLTVVAVLLGLAFARVTGAVGGDPVVAARLVDAGGSLRPGSDVKVRGVIVGRVSAITRGTDGGVRVDLRMREEDLGRVPRNVVARILPATVFGNSFVDLTVHGRPADASLRAGDVVRADRTQDTLELQQALDDVDRLVTALGPAELASALGSAARALDGRGERIGDLVDRADAYLGRLNPRLPLLRRDVRELADAIEVVDRVAPDLLAATDDGLVTLRTVVQQEAAIAAFLMGGTSLARTTGGFLEENRGALVRFVDDVALVLDALHDERRSAITDSIAVNNLIGERLRSIEQHGFLHMDAVLQLAVPDYYDSADRPSYAAGSGRSSRPAPRRSPTGFAALVEGGGDR